MTLADEIGAEGGGDDILAAEYVLGVLPADERQIVARRLETDAAFARMVDHWEAHLSPLAAGYGEAEPPAAAKAAIDRRLFSAIEEPAGSPVSSGQQGGLWTSIGFWRGLAVAAVAVFAIYVALPYLNPPIQTPQVRLVASLSADGTDVRYLAVYDAGSGDVALSHVSGERGAGHDFELWMIDGDNLPVSMGVIPIGAATHVAVKAAAKTRIASGAVLAVSLEPPGGSPTGQPTGPVVAAGDLRSI